MLSTRRRGEFLRAEGRSGCRCTSTLSHQNASWLLRTKLLSPLTLKLRAISVVRATTIRAVVMPMQVFAGDDEPTKNSGLMPVHCLNREGIMQSMRWMGVVLVAATWMGLLSSTARADTTVWSTNAAAC